MSRYSRLDHRWAAFLGVAALTLSYVSVLYHVTDVVGGAALMVGVVGAAFALGVVAGRTLSPRTATLLTAASLVVGGAVYFLSVPSGQRELLSIDRLVSDTVALVTGLSVLRLTQANVWALAVAPGPVFLSWYFAARHRYALSTLVGGSALSLFVLTGDAGTVTTMAGVVAAAVTLGVGTFDHYGVSETQFDTLVMLVTAMVVVSAVLSLVPGSAAEPLLPDRGSPTVEASLVEADDSIAVLGSIRLSPAVRFTVESPEREYWQTAAYDRYTGTGWVRSGGTRPYEGNLSEPPGPSRPLVQTVTAKTSLAAMPAAWRPTDLGGTAVLAGQVEATPQGGLRPGTPLETGQSYTVTSRVPEYTTAELRRAGTDYPEDVSARYLQLPESTSDRVRARGANVTADAETPYAKATAIESHLESNKRYSLTVERPSGGTADAFLFEMDAGYCTYYATTMVVMLRAEGVPARFVTGYTPGERGDDGTWTVRGLDSHAWVQVYFPDVGWVRFDPTPAGPRERAEDTRLAEARQRDETGATAPDESDPQPTPTPTSTPTSTASTDTGSTPTPTPEGTGVLDSTEGEAASSSGGSGLPEMPSRRVLALWGVALVGAVAGARRSGVTARIYRRLWLRYQPASDDPVADTRRAFARVEAVLERRYRPRRQAETRREFVQRLRDEGGLDGATYRRVEAALQTYERARYADGVTRGEADAVMQTADGLARREPLVDVLSGR